MSETPHHSDAMMLVGAALVVGLLAGCQAGTPRETTRGPESRQTVRCAVIGGMIRTGMWPAVAQRFEERTGHRVELVVTGPKDVIAPAMRDGQVDLITMHASDTIINLVADGYATEPWPWARNDLVIAGPRDDPAGIRGLTDAAEAIRKIAGSKARLVVHQSVGVQEVLNDIMREAGVEPDAEHLFLAGEKPDRFILEYAARHHAYTIVGRIPFRDGKMPDNDLELMVQGDPRLRRPYVVAIANPKRWPEARCAAARELAQFLRSAETQAWLAEFGRGQLDDRPLFFPIAPESQHPGPHNHSEPGHRRP